MKAIRIFLISTLAVFTAIQCSKESGDKNMTALVVSVGSTDYTGTINGTNVTFTDKVPYGTTEASIKTITVSDKASSNKSVGDKLTVGTANTITVTAEDGSTQDYSVTISALDAMTGKSITNLVVTAGSTDYNSTINGTTITFASKVPYGTTQVSIKTLTLSEGATANKAVNDTLTVSGANTIVVTAQDNSTQSYSVTIGAEEAGSGKAITNLIVTAGSTDYTGAISGTTITFSSIPEGTTQVSIKTLELSTYATANKSVGDMIAISGTSTIIVTSQNMETQSYTIVINTLDTAIIGTWKIASEAGAMGVGPNVGDYSWWSLSAADVTARSCLLDDTYILNANGSFQNNQGDMTWLESWQVGVDADGCGTPVAPHNGSNTGTWNATNGVLTIVGNGNFMGLPKVHNSGEDGMPANNTTKYNYTLSNNNNTLQVTISGFQAANPSATWYYKFTKQ